MEQLIELGVFFGKLVLVLAFVGVLLSLLAGTILRLRQKPQMEVENLNEKMEELAEVIAPFVYEKKQYKRLLKEKKKNLEHLEKTASRLFVLNFNGDIAAHQVEALREEITAVIGVAQPKDEVLVQIESPGGMVHGYGLAAAQILRLKDAGLHVTAAVDKVAASGGYMMACTADKIIAAPFAIVGSIGVVAQVPNFHKLLKKHDVDYEEYTAGEYKRTVSVFGEITEKGRQKFLEQMEDTHTLFKTFVSRFRPDVKLDQVATGEYWYGERAINMGLVDALKTSDQFLMEQAKSKRLIRIKMLPRKKLSEKLQDAVHAGVTRAIEQLVRLNPGL